MGGEGVQFSFSTSIRKIELVLMEEVEKRELIAQGTGHRISESNLFQGLESTDLLYI